MTLYGYQQAAVDTLVARGNKSAYLGYEMGLGKTAIAIETAKRRGAKRVLVIGPAIGRLTWEKEVGRWAGAKLTHIMRPVDVTKLAGDGWFFISYNLLSMSRSGYDYTSAVYEALCGRVLDMTVLDEAQALKNPTSIRTKAVLKILLPGLGWVLPMSGTPAPNHAGELFPILSAIHPEAVEGAYGKRMKLYEFEDTYCEVVSKWFNGRVVRVIEGSRNLPTLKAKMNGFMLRLKKRDALPDLPDMTFDTYPLDVSAQAVASVGKFPQLDGLDDDDFLRALQSEHVMKVRHAIGAAKVVPAVEALVTALEGSRRKVVVYAHHTDVLHSLHSMLAEYNPVKIEGATSKPDREKAVSRFLDDPKCRVFVGQIQAAGTSITLVGPGNDVSDVFFVEASYSPGDNVQAASRIHRIGQRNAVQVWFFVAHETIDDRIMDILSRKTADFHQLFG